MLVGASFRVRGEFGGDTLAEQVEFPDEFAERLLSIFSDDIDAELSVKLKLKPEPTPVNHLDPVHLSIWLDKQLILEINTEEQYGTYVALNADYFGQVLKDVIARYGFDPEKSDFYEVECLFEWSPVKLRAASLEDNNRRGLNSAILAIANYVVAALGFWYRMPCLVAADRGLIDDSDLTFLASASAHVSWLEQAEPSIRASIDGASMQQTLPAFSRLRHLVHQGLIQKPCNPMAPIGGSRLAVHTQDKVKELEVYGLCLGEDMSAQAMHKFAGVPEAVPHEHLHNYVNRCLSDHLFLDQGYQLDFDICEVIRPDNIGPPAGFPYITKTIFGGYSLHTFALVVCFLRDRSEQLITFADVGTGLSCVLRVCAHHHRQQADDRLTS